MLRAINVAANILNAPGRFSIRMSWDLLLVGMDNMKFGRIAQ
jgi:hypothetical protein